MNKTFYWIELPARECGFPLKIPSSDRGPLTALDIFLIVAKRRVRSPAWGIIHSGRGNLIIYLVDGGESGLRNFQVVDYSKATRLRRWTTYSPVATDPLDELNDCSQCEISKAPVAWRRAQ